MLAMYHGLVRTQLATSRERLAEARAVEVEVFEVAKDLESTVAVCKGRLDVAFKGELVANEGMVVQGLLQTMAMAKVHAAAARKTLEDKVLQQDRAVVVHFKEEDFNDLLSEMSNLETLSDALSSTVDDFAYRDWKDVVPDVESTTETIEDQVETLKGKIDDVQPRP